MKRSRHIITVAVLLSGTCAPCAQAQGTGTLRVLCEPNATCTYVLDGKHRMSDRELTLLEGPHRLVLFAPERRMLDTTVLVKPGALNELRVQLRYSEEFIAYNKKAQRFGRDDRWLRYGTPVLAVGAAAWFGISTWKAVDAQQTINDLETTYNESANPARIADLKGQEIPEANRKLRQARTIMAVSGGVLVASGAAWWYVKKVRAKRTPPVFEDKEKARFDGLVWMPDANGHGTWMAGLTIPLR